MTDTDNGGLAVEVFVHGHRLAPSLAHEVFALADQLAEHGVQVRPSKRIWASVPTTEIIELVIVGGILGQACRVALSTVVRLLIERLLSKRERERMDDDAPDSQIIFTDRSSVIRARMDFGALASFDVRVAREECEAYFCEATDAKYEPTLTLRAPSGELRVFPATASPLPDDSRVLLVAPLVRESERGQFIGAEIEGRPPFALTTGATMRGLPALLVSRADYEHVCGAPRTQ